MQEEARGELLSRPPTENKKVKKKLYIKSKSIYKDSFFLYKKIIANNKKNNIFIISKKLGNAVKRNYFKRLLRFFFNNNNTVAIHNNSFIVIANANDIFLKQANKKTIKRCLFDSVQNFFSILEKM